MHQAWHQSAKLRPSALDAAMFLRSRHVELLCSSVDFPKTMQTVHVVVHSEVSGAYWLMSGEGSSKATTRLHMLHDATLKLMVTLSLATPIVDVSNALCLCISGQAVHVAFTALRGTQKTNRMLASKIFWKIRSECW